MKAEELVKVLEEVITLDSQVVTRDTLYNPDITQTDYMLYWSKEAECFVIGPVTDFGLTRVTEDYFTSINKLFKSMYTSEEIWLNNVVALWNNIASTIHFKNTINPTLILYCKVEKAVLDKQDTIIDSIPYTNLNGVDFVFDVFFSFSTNTLNLILKVDGDEEGQVVQVENIDSNPETVNDYITEIGTYHYTMVKLITDDHYTKHYTKDETIEEEVDVDELQSLFESPFEEEIVEIK